MPSFGIFEGGLFFVFLIINVAFWVGLFALIFLGIRWLIRQNASDRSRSADPPEDTALELLRQRYARGEIDATEYEERRRTLGA
jgi:putative membrane protein